VRIQSEYTQEGNKHDSRLCSQNSRRITGAFEYDPGVLKDEEVEINVEYCGDLPQRSEYAKK
jgi:hypothetical protein